MRTAADLRGTLARIDGRGYKAYKDLRGAYRLDSGAELHLDHIQGDPFAAPSLARIRFGQALAKLPPALFENRTRRIALEDVLAREMRDALAGEVRGRRGSGKSGVVTVDAGGQEVLERTAAVVNAEFGELRLQAGLPAAGRRVLGRQAEAMLLGDIPRAAERALLWERLPHEAVERFVQCVEDQEHVRALLPSLDLVAFVGDGSNLPRASGASDRPMEADRAVAFVAPASLGVTIPLPEPIGGGDAPRSWTGLGIPRGVTLVVGGGYHGKSTLLRAVERGVYPHVPGDGRERVVTDPAAAKIRAEDGRRVERTDIRAFIDDLPMERSTAAFSSDDASGSTSQAANIMEALEGGATALLLDEDTSATNFMVRDARMQALVAREHEPITPFLDRVREVWETLKVSALLVMGGSGDYLDVADRVIMMRDYRPLDATGEASAVAKAHPTARAPEAKGPLRAPVPRIPVASSFDPSRGRREVKIQAREVDLIAFGREDIDLRGVEQLVDRSQTRAAGLAIHLAAKRFMDGKRTLREVLDALEQFLDEKGLDALDPFFRPGQHPGNLARPRVLEIAAAINRLRSVRMRQRGGP
jgi:predicted ABC-class ATPase